MRDILLSLFFVTVFVNTALTQFDTSLVKTNGPKYEYGDRIDLMHNLEDLFIVDQEADGYFQSFDRARKKQRTVNYMSTGLFASSVGGALLAYNDNNAGGGLAAAIIFVYGSALSGIVAIIGNVSSGTNKGKYKDQLIEFVNRRNIGTQIEDGRLLVITSLPQRLKYLESRKVWELNGREETNLEELKSELSFDEISDVLFLEYKDIRRRKKNARNFTYVFGGVTLVSTIVNRTLVSPDTRKDTGHILLTQGIPILATLVSLGHLNKKSKKEKNKRLQFINYMNGVPTDISFKERGKLEFNSTINGLGFVFSF